MAYTLTIQEVNTNKAWVNKKVYDRVVEYAKKERVGQDISKTYLSNLQLMIVLNSTLKTWEQGKFTDTEYINYLTNMGYLNLIHKLKSL